MTTRILSSDDCETLLDHATLIDALADAHQALSRGEAHQPVPLAIDLSGGLDTRAERPLLTPMMGAWNGHAVFKLLADRPTNREEGAPAQRSTVALYDVKTAECLALIDGRALTRIRTAAATALATSRLAPSHARVLGLIGAGKLAIEHMRSHAHLGYRDVVVWSRSEESARYLASQAPDGVNVTVRASPHEVLSDADVVCTLTPSRRPLISGADVRPGTHLNALGSPPRHTYSELFPDVYDHVANVIVDSRNVVLSECGNVLEAIKHGTLAAGDLVELGEVIAGTRPGRTSDTDTTVFNSVGIGMQDLVAAQLALRRAELIDGGIAVELRPSIDSLEETP